MASDKTLLMRNLQTILEDHQRRLFLDLSAYVEQLPSAPNPRPCGAPPHGAAIGTEKLTRFDAEEMLEVCPVQGRSTTTLSTSSDPALRRSRDLKRSQSYIQAKGVGEAQREVCPFAGVGTASTASESPRAGTSRTSRRASTRRSESYMLAKEVSESENSNRFLQAATKVLSSDSMQQLSGHCKVWLERLVDAWQFEAFFSLVIITNSIFIGVTVQLESMEDAVYDKTVILAIQLAYGVLFTIELLLRLGAVGPKDYFCAPHTAWNWFDTLIVFSVVYDVITVLVHRSTTSDDAESGIISSAAGNLRILRVLRLARLTRIFRVLRVVRFVQPLQTLVHAIIEAMKALLWALVLLFLINYMFAILLTEVVNRHLAEPDVGLTAREVVVLQKFFGWLSSSMLTLFMSISGGLSWVEAVYPLLKISWIWVFAFCLYVAFSLFAMLNVMTGVFCQSAIKGAERDQEMAVQNLLLDTEKLRRTLQQLFNKLDDAQTGTLTLSDLEKHFDDDDVRVLFETLELKATDAWTLFQSIDHDGDCKIDMEEFLSGCVELRGPAKAVDLFALRNEVSKVREELGWISEGMASGTRAGGTRLPSGTIVDLGLKS